MEIQIYPDLNALSRAAAVEFVRLAGEAVVAKGVFTTALSSGSTPRALYHLLGTDPLLSAHLPCTRMHFFWGDERFVPPDDPDSNFAAAQESMFSRLRVPTANIHRVPTQVEDAADAAKQYDREMHTFFRLSPGERPRFDLMLLGLGRDGHTASLFPHSAALAEKEKLVVEVWVEKFKAHRIAVTPPVFNHAVNIIFLVDGEERAEALHRVLEGECNPELIPAQMIRPRYGRLVWMVDQAAASQLTPELTATKT